LALSTEDLYDKATSLSSNVEDNFLELGKTLRQLLDRDPQLFQKLVGKDPQKRRKMYYMVEVSRIFDPLPVPRSRLRKIGWTKLQLIGKHVNPDNMEELLELAEANNAKELERHMRGEKPLGNAHVVLMYFSPKEYKELEEALVQNGGTRSGRGIQNKEKALMNVIRKVRSKAAVKDEV
jgi:hypothetical protein